MYLKYLSIYDSVGVEIRHVDFKKGVNIIKGQESSTSIKTQTNSLGKTTLLRCIDKVGDRALLWTITGRISDIEQNSSVSFAQHKYTVKRELESFVSEEETPFSPPMPIQGELPKDLL